MQEDEMAYDSSYGKIGVTHPDRQLGGLTPTSDPWAHRSDGMKCKTCLWFVPKRPNTKLGNSYDVGRCRRHAPTMSGYPAVFVNDWCGDHKIDENKI